MVCAHSLWLYKLGVFTHTPQLQSLRLSSAYTLSLCFTLPHCLCCLAHCLCCFAHCLWCLAHCLCGLAHCSLLLLTVSLLVLTAFTVVLTVFGVVLTVLGIVHTSSSLSLIVLFVVQPTVCFR